MQMDGCTALFDNATIEDCKLLSMGAIATNGYDTNDVPAIYLCDLQETTASFAVRIINIPAFAYDVDISVTPYIVVEVDGVATTVYGDVQTCSYNDVKN